MCHQLLSACKTQLPNIFLLPASCQVEARSQANEIDQQLQAKSDNYEPGFTSQVNVHYQHAEGLDSWSKQPEGGVAAGK